MLNPFKTILKLLLLITMVVEPVLLSYAMAGVGHQHRGFGMTSELKLEQETEHAAMSHHGMHLMAEHVSQQADMADTGEVDNCCATPACAAAAMQSFPNLKLKSIRRSTALSMPPGKPLFYLLIPNLQDSSSARQAKSVRSFWTI